MTKPTINPLAKEVPLALFKKTISKYQVLEVVNALRQVCGSSVSVYEPIDISSSGHAGTEIVWTCPLLLTNGDALNLTVEMKMTLSFQERKKVELITLDKWIYSIPEMNAELVAGLHRAWCTSLNTAMDLLTNKKQGIQLWWPEKTMLDKLGWAEELNSPCEDQQDAATYLVYAIQKDPESAAKAWPYLVPWTSAISMLHPPPSHSENANDWSNWSETLGALYLHEVGEQLELPPGTTYEGPTF